VNNIKGVYDEVTLVDAQRITFKGGANHGVSVDTSKVNTGDTLMVDTHGRIWKMERIT